MTRRPDPSHAERSVRRRLVVVLAAATSVSLMLGALAAPLYDAARFGRQGAASCDEQAPGRTELRRTEAGDLATVVPVAAGGEPVGTLTLVRSHLDVRRLAGYLPVLGVVAVLAALFGLFLAGSVDAHLTVANDVLDMSKIEAGHLEIDRRHFDVIDLVDQCAEIASVRGLDKGLRFIVDVDPGMPDAVIGDGTRIRQILLNLLSNATKFTERGEIELRALGSASGGDVRLRFEVRDTGIGMGPDQLARVFDDFVQADSSTSREFGGTGLGLPISRRLAELMGGEITARSVAGQGSTFRLDVPVQAQPRSSALEPSWRALLVSGTDWRRRTLAAYARSLGGEVVAVAPDEAVIAARRARGAFDVAVVDGQPPTGFAGALDDSVRRVEMSSLGDPPRRSRVGRVLAPRTITGPTRAHSAPRLELHVLLVDDNEVNRLVARKLLSGMGCQVTEAADGFEAVEAARTAAPDVILMDCQMPGMDGYRATSRIRQLPGSVGRVPIVALTANAMSTEERTCREAGMDDYLAKPFRPQELESMLIRWAGGAAQVAS